MAKDTKTSYPTPQELRCLGSNVDTLGRVHAGPLLGLRDHLLPVPLCHLSYVCAVSMFPLLRKDVSQGGRAVPNDLILT